MKDMEDIVKILNTGTGMPEQTVRPKINLLLVQSLNFFFHMHLLVVLRSYCIVKHFVPFILTFTVTISCVKTFGTITVLILRT